MKTKLFSLFLILSTPYSYSMLAELQAKLSSHAGRLVVAGVGAYVVYQGPIENIRKDCALDKLKALSYQARQSTDPNVQEWGNKADIVIMASYMYELEHPLFGHGTIRRRVTQEINSAPDSLR